MLRNHKSILVTILLLLMVSVACGQSTDPGLPQVSPAKPTRIVVRMLKLDVVLISTPSPTLAPLPTLAFTPTPPSPAPSGETQTTVSATSTPSCTNLAEFVSHLTIADNTALVAGQPFAKIWRIKNTGTCTWTTDYALKFSGGEEMGNATRIPFQQVVQPGENVDLRVDLTAPMESNTYSASWALQDSGGSTFGLGPDSSQPIALIIFVKPVPPATPG